MDVALVSMPWCSLFNPSIQIGILRHVLADAGYRTVARSYQLRFADHLLARSSAAGVRFSLPDYSDIALSNSSLGLGDWIFAIPPYRSSSWDDDAGFFQHLRSRGAPRDLVDLAPWMREQTQSFLDACVEDLAGIKVIGFTTGFSQTVASLVLARMLKDANPSVKIVFGGAGCDGVMGKALIRVFPWVDAVVRGEGEGVLPGLVGDLLDGRAVHAQPGLCTRLDGKVDVSLSERTANQRLDAVPTPDYTEFFETLDDCSFRGQVYPALELCLESSRGCWWGEKQHCTFCGLNGETLTFRRKSPEKFVAELAAQSEKHHTLGFLMTDAIMDMSFFQTALPHLEQSSADYRIFFEVKANLRREQVAQLRRAGVLHIQPGIESLSTPILRSMRKGVTALQNVRLIKWCRQFGINVLWNIIYGFPGESSSEYEAMSDLCLSLTHLQPPSLVPLALERFSPYHMNPAAFGLEITGAPTHYRWVLPDTPEARQQWMDLTYRFEYRHLDGRNPENYVQPLRRNIEDWQQHFVPAPVPLRYLTGRGFITIIDERPNLRRGRYTLDGIDAALYVACECGATPSQLERQLAGGDNAPSEAYIIGLLEQLRTARLVCALDGHYLSLAVSMRDNLPSVLVTG